MDLINTKILFGMINFLLMAINLFLDFNRS